MAIQLIETSIHTVLGAGRVPSWVKNTLDSYVPHTREEVCFSLGSLFLMIVRLRGASQWHRIGDLQARLPLKMEMSQKAHIHHLQPPTRLHPVAAAATLILPGFFMSPYACVSTLVGRVAGACSSGVPSWIMARLSQDRGRGLTDLKLVVTLSGAGAFHLLFEQYLPEAEIKESYPQIYRVAETIAYCYLGLLCLAHARDVPRLVFSLGMDWILDSLLPTIAVRFSLSDEHLDMLSAITLVFGKVGWFLDLWGSKEHLLMDLLTNHVVGHLHALWIQPQLDINDFTSADKKRLERLYKYGRAYPELIPDQNERNT